MNIARITVLVGLGLTLAACGSKDPSGGEPNTPMGDSAPAFTDDLKTFAVGAWAEVAMDSVNLNKKWIFKDDGTFIFHTEDPWRAEGVWSAKDNAIIVEYKTLDGLPWADAQAKVQKAEEGGGQAAIAEAIGMKWVFEDLPRNMRIVVDKDKKHMKFSNAVEEEPAPDPNATPQGATTEPSMPDLGSFNIDDFKSIQIERLK